MTLWWERIPDRFNWELQSLKEHKIEFSIHESAKKNGFLKIFLSVQTQFGKVDLVARFPENYPYFRFEITAPKLQLDHHQNPIDKNLCFFGRRTWYWDTNNTLASVIKDSLEKVIIAGKSQNQNEVVGIEQVQAEPISDYFSYANGLIGIDSTWKIPAGLQEGRLRVQTIKPISCERNYQIRGVVSSISDLDGKTIAEIDSTWNKALSQEYVNGIWVRSKEPIVQENPRLMIQAMQSQFPDKALFSSKEFNPSEPLVIGLTFPEETGWRETGMGWLFIGSPKISPSAIKSEIRLKTG